jgi:hypothetical protein
MKLDNKTRLIHMIESTENAIGFLNNKQLDDLFNDRLRYKESETDSFTLILMLILR